MYANTAARYWSTVLSSIGQGYPDCRTIRLRGMSEQSLEPGILDPLGTLSSELFEVREHDANAALAETVDQLNLVGPPEAVRMELLDHHGASLSDTPDPDSALDSETFSYITCWLYEWTRLPPEKWQEPELSGYVMAEDLAANVVYHLEYINRRRHVSEGLFEQQLDVSFHRIQVEK